MFSSDPVGLAAALQRPEDGARQQGRHQGLPAGRVLHGYEGPVHPGWWVGAVPAEYLLISATPPPPPLPHTGKSQAPVFDVFEAFISTDNIQVFANAAVDYIMCLMKFVKGLGGSADGGPASFLLFSFYDDDVCRRFVQSTETVKLLFDPCHRKTKDLN